jgi:hypothetical protein
MASIAFPHPEETAKRSSRRTRWPKHVAAVALVLGACVPQPEEPAPAVPLGIRQPLHAGSWEGPMGGTMIDFHIDQVSPTQVAIRVSGAVIHPPRGVESVQTYFYDRPKTCSRRPDGRTFDCPRYADMHIDNGLLCGSYVLEGQTYRPCFQPVR